jgi:hypothetical protein
MFQGNLQQQQSMVKIKSQSHCWEREQGLILKKMFERETCKKTLLFISPSDKKILPQKFQNFYFGIFLAQNEIKKLSHDLLSSLIQQK